MEWSDSLTVGNATMDSDHQHLFGMVRTVEHALRSGDGKILAQSFQRLLMGVEIHLSNEDRFARELGIAFEEHRKRHHSQQRELEHLRAELEGKSGIWSESAAEHFSRSLWSWVSDHLDRDKAELKPVLSDQPYHFKP